MVIGGWTICWTKARLCSFFFGKKYAIVDGRGEWCTSDWGSATDVFAAHWPGWRYNTSPWRREETWSQILNEPQECLVTSLRVLQHLRSLPFSASESLGNSDRCQSKARSVNGQLAGLPGLPKMRLDSFRPQAGCCSSAEHRDFCWKDAAFSSLQPRFVILFQHIFGSLIDTLVD